MQLVDQKIGKRLQKRNLLLVHMEVVHLHIAKPCPSKKNGTASRLSIPHAFICTYSLG